MSELKQIPEVEARLDTHEQICAERYKGIQESFQRVDERFQDGSQKFKRLEYILYAVMAAVLLGPGAAAAFFKNLIGL